MKTYGYAQNKRKRLDHQAVTAYNEENITFRNVIIRLSALHKVPEEERKVSVLGFVQKYGFLGFMTALPTMAEFICPKIHVSPQKPFISKKKEPKEMIESRNANIIADADGKKMVLINDIRFKAKVRDDWNIVEEYLKEYIGKFYEIEETSDKIYISAEEHSQI